MEQTIQLNVIPFKPTVNEITCNFHYIKPENGSYASIYVDNIATVLEGKVDTSLLSEENKIYTNFTANETDTFQLKIKLSDNPLFALHYYRQIITEYFRTVADVMYKNFTKDVEVWFKSNEQPNAKYSIYYKFTLKVQHARLTDGPEIVLSFDGKSKVYDTPIGQLSNLDPAKYYKWVIYNKRLHHWKFLDPVIKNDLDNVFLLVNNSIKPKLGITFDTPDFTNRYPKYKSYLEHFYTAYLNTEPFNEILDVTHGFYKPYSDQVSNVSAESKELQYGLSTGTNPKNDFKRGKPFRPISNNHPVKFFFIYQLDQKSTVITPLYKWLVKGYNDGKYPFPPMEQYISQPLNLDLEANISFDSIENAFETIRKAVKNYNKDPDTKYMALFVTPIPKSKTKKVIDKLYVQVKELLLLEGISSQVIKSDSILSLGSINQSFNTYLPHIEIAILAKLGGIPWRLNRPTTNELIVGVGAFYSVTHNTRFVGSAICFNNEGIFKGFDCFKSADNISLAGSIREAVAKFIAVNYQASRLIIHFYKDISKKEVKPIVDTLHALGLKIPVIVITVNKTESSELLGFDIADQKNLMPYSGSIVKVGHSEYLLFNNTRYDKTSVPRQKEYHFPIKLSFRCTQKGVIDNIEAITPLIDQVYQFSRMYWKCTDQQSLPVTVKYPSMVAEIFPHFKIDRPNDYMKENLWFL